MERTNPGKRIEAKIEKENRTITIKATTDATEGTIKLMVDTGSQISLIAKERIKQGAKITQKGYIISGIAGKDHAIRTEGTIQAKITINETELEEEFIIMEEKYLRPYDGYLGCEFLNRMKGSINLEDDKLILKQEERIIQPEGKTKQMQEQTDNINEEAEEEPQTQRDKLVAYVRYGHSINMEAEQYVKYFASDNKEEVPKEQKVRTNHQRNRKDIIVGELELDNCNSEQAQTIKRLVDRYPDPYKGINWKKPT